MRKKERKDDKEGGRRGERVEKERESESKTIVL